MTQLRLFPFITRIKSKGARRAVMALISPLVLVEYMINGAIVFVMDYKILWNADIQ